MEKLRYFASECNGNKFERTESLTQFLFNISMCDIISDDFPKHMIGFLKF